MSASLSRSLQRGFTGCLKRQVLSRDNVLISHHQRRFSSAAPAASGVKIIDFTFIEMKNPSTNIAVGGREGVSVLDVALEHNIDIEGACGGQMACSTCHVILDESLYDALPAKTDEEQDMLDLAWGLQPTYVASLYICVLVCK
jgi:ferredoxin